MPYRQYLSYITAVYIKCKSLRWMVFFSLSTSKSLTFTSRCSVSLTLFSSFNVAPSNLFKNVDLPAPAQPTMMQREWQMVRWPSLRNFLSWSLSISFLIKVDAASIKIFLYAFSQKKLCHNDTIRTQFLNV